MNIYDIVVKLTNTHDLYAHIDLSNKAAQSLRVNDACEDTIHCYKHVCNDQFLYANWETILQKITRDGYCRCNILGALYDKAISQEHCLHFAKLLFWHNIYCGTRDLDIINSFCVDDAIGIIDSAYILMYMNRKIHTAVTGRFFIKSFKFIDLLSTESHFLGFLDCLTSETDAFKDYLLMVLEDQITPFARLCAEYILTRKRNHSIRDPRYNLFCKLADI